MHTESNSFEITEKTADSQDHSSEQNLLQTNLDSNYRDYEKDWLNKAIKDLEDKGILQKLSIDNVDNSSNKILYPQKQTELGKVHPERLDTETISFDWQTKNPFEMHMPKKQNHDSPWADPNSNNVPWLPEQTKPKNKEAVPDNKQEIDFPHKQRDTNIRPKERHGELRPEDLPPLDPAQKQAFEQTFNNLSQRIFSGELKPQPGNIVAIHANGGEVWDQAKLLWAINRPAEAPPPNVSDGNMPFSGPSTISAKKFVEILKTHGSHYAEARENVNVRMPDGNIQKVSLDMGQLAKLYEVKWREQGHLAVNAAALLAQSEHEINLANLEKLGRLPGVLGPSAVDRTRDTNQWAGIKWKKNTFRCEPTEVNWEQVAAAKWAGPLSRAGNWGDKKETRKWSSPGTSMCGWYEHIAEKYLSTGRHTAASIIPMYVGAAGGAHYIPGFAKHMRAFTDFR